MQASRDQNFVPTLLGVSNVDGTTPITVYADPVTHRLLVDLSSGTGTVQTVSVATANGFAGTSDGDPTDPILTLTTTVTGIVKGNGTALSQAIAGTDYVAPGSVLTSGLTMTTARILGRTTASSGAIEEITIGSGLSLSAGTLSASSSSFNLTVEDGVTSVSNVDTIVFSGATITDDTGGQITVTIDPSGVQTITGTSNRITVDNTDPANPVIDIAATYVGQNTITTLGTITTGVWNAGAVTSNGLVTGTAFVPTSSTIPTNGIYLPAANTLGWAINSAAEMQLTSSALSPAADGGSSLGTTALGWQNLFANTGFVINIENGNWVATHTSGILTVGTGDLRITTAGTNTASVVTVGGTQTLTAKTLTSPTITTASLSGTQLFEENASIGLDPSLSADGTWTGITMTATAGYTQSFGDLVYLDPTDGRWEATDANSAAGADGDARGILGMVVVAGTDGNSCTILLNGVIRADAKFPTFTVNNQIYVSETAGLVTQTQPTTTDVVIRVVGQALTTDAMYFNPSSDYITHV